MTDTGQVPGEGQPESAGMVEQPGVPAHGAYTYLSEAPAEDEDLLLPGAQGAWGNEVPPPAPEPVVEAVHEPGPHETAGRDSGSVDLSGVRLPDPAPASVPPSSVPPAAHDPAVAPQPPRRPLHLGPPIPDASASPVRSLADRGPAGAPVRQPGPPAPGPEYLDAQPLYDMAPQSAAPWGATPAAVAQAGAPAPAAETVDPASGPVADTFAEPVDPSGAAQATLARLATQAAAQAPAPVQVVHGHDGVQPAHGHDGVNAAPAEQGPESTQEAAQAAGSAAAEGAPVAEASAAAEAGQSADGAVAAPESGEPGQGAEVHGQETDAVEPGSVQETVVQQAPGGALADRTPDAGQVTDSAEAAGSAQQPEAAPEAAQPGEGPEQGGTAQEAAGAETADAAQAPAVAEGAVPGQDAAETEAAVPAEAVADAVTDAAQVAAETEVAVPAQGVDEDAAQPQSDPHTGGVAQAQPGVAEAETGVPEAQPPAAETAQPGAADASSVAADAPPADAQVATGAEAQPGDARSVPGEAQVVPGAEARAAMQAAPADVQVTPVSEAQLSAAQTAPDAGGQSADARSVPADAQVVPGAEGQPAAIQAAPADVPVTPVSEAQLSAGQAVPGAEGQSADAQSVPADVQAAPGAAQLSAAQAVPGAEAQAPAAQSAPADVQAPGAEAQPAAAHAAPGDAQAVPGAEAHIADAQSVPSDAEVASTAEAQPAPDTEAVQAPVASTAEAQPAPGTEAVQAPASAEAPESLTPGAVPDAAETGASAAQDGVQAPAAAEGDHTPEPHLPAQGPQLAGPALSAESVPGAPQAQPPAHPEPQAQAQPEPSVQDGPHQTAPEAEPAPATGPGVPAGPQVQPAEPAPGPAGAEAAATQPETAPAGAATGLPGAAGQPASAGTTETLPSGVPLEPHPEQPLGQFVPVDGQVPTTPHLAPTPPQPLVLPAEALQGPQDPQGPQASREQPEPVATVPAPREAEPATVPAASPTPDVVQHAEDLQTRAADQEESTAEVAEAQQSTGPAAPGYADAEREAVLKVMRERRDIRNGFRGDPIPHEVLLRVLEAAHTAPSVGHSQPWDFVVIRSAETRRAMHELAMRQREAYAKSLPKGRAKQFKELKIEAILDTPVNIVVTADPTRGGRHTLGRHTQPQMAPYSSALAVENLWLAARAEGLGVGWVSFFDEREMVRTLGLPEHLEVVAYLCVGYVDEFPDEPELMQAGWSKRRPLSWVVHEETYGRRALPGEDPHDLLAETVAQIRPLDAKALGEAWERQKRMTKPAGALGMLEIISAQLSGLSRQCPPPIPEPAAVAIFAGDHGVHAQGVTPWPQEVTAQMVANFLGGGAVCNAFANQVGAEVCVVDVGVVADLPATPGLLPRKIRGGTSDMTTGPAMTREEAKAAIEVGIETARDLVAAGNKALLTGEMGIANTTASAALISVFTGADPAEVTGRGTGINDETLARKTEVVRRALELHQPDPADPIGVLAAIGGFEHAAMVGLLLGGASLRTPVILDGVSAGAAALVARAIAPEVLAACIAGHRSAEPGHVAALNKLGLRPLVDLDLRLGEGTGALLALPLVQSTARAMHEVATFDSAGVTEK
ncbi:nicotinate-nucleotide--dimethylbenzimidazole phosphoribosyltransferase [Streptomyces sp. NPDC006314]|uniref:nicotinate-nucleotide--dimethylbenzimidazole phosphoribosyltransferase n=1 Tax=Streptomyces sp. NPDC006314 TaxID=3154475 RepID=UPI0033AA769C